MNIVKQFAINVKTNRIQSKYFKEVFVNQDTIQVGIKDGKIIIIPIKNDIIKYEFEQRIIGSKNRITIPKSMFKELDINKNDILIVTLNKEKITFEKLK